MDTVFIENLDIETVIGAYDWERDMRQHVHLDVRMDHDCRAAGASDALADALDYHTVAMAVTDLVQAGRYQLLEALAENVAAMVLRDFPVSRVRICVRKPGAIEHAAAVGVAIERSAAA